MTQEMHAVVTGGAGFIGSHLSRFLLNRGFAVTVIDNLITGKKENIADLVGHPRFIFHRANVLDFDFQAFCGVQYIYHLASPASVIDYQKYQEMTAEVNTYGTHKILKFAHCASVKVLFSSTSEVYGDPNVHPQSEEYWGNVNPIGVRAPYDEAKRFGETLCSMYHRVYGTDVRIVRIFNTYGPNMRPNDGRVISNFVNQALRGESITVYGDGSQTRSFCYVDDMVNGLYAAMVTDGTKGEVINLGNPDECTMRELAEKIRGMTGSRSSITFTDLPEDDPARRRPDIATAQKLLKWYPQEGLKEGLEKTIAYYRTLL